jgi:O-antigen/teichoic acid export membrane protein
VLQLIRRNVGLKFLGEIVSRTLFLFFFFYVGRKIGAIEFGRLNLAISVTYILGVLVLDPGLALATIQLIISRNSEADHIASTIFTYKVLLFGPMCLILWGVSKILGPRLPSFSILMIAALYVLFTAILEYFCSVTNAFHRMDLEAWLKIFYRVCIVLFGFVALQFGHLTTVLWAMLLATFLGCVVGWIVLRQQIVTINLTWNPDIMKEALRLGLPIAGTLIVGTIYLKWDLLMLSYFNINKQQIGWYSGAFDMLEACGALPAMLGAALFPLMVQLRTENPGNLDRLLNSTTKAILLLSIFGATAVSLFSRPIMTLVYGAAYSPGASVLAILFWCIVPLSLYFYFMYANISAGHARYNFIGGCLALVTGFVANVFLIPRFGYLGAAWAALVANCSFAMFSAWKVSSLFRGAGLPWIMLRVLTAGVLMLLIGLYVPAPLGLRFVLGVAVYIVVLAFAGIIKEEDLALLIRIAHLQPEPQV